MHAIVDNIYIGDQFPGATLGVINMPHGLIQVDAPPSPEDGRAWRAALLNLGGGSERLLVNLDAHPDRTLGDRAMDCTIVAQEKTAHVFRTRPTTFKAQGEETGSDWESIPGLGNIRWVTPEITFSHQMAIHWGDSSVILEHHPGPTAGAALGASTLHGQLGGQFILAGGATTIASLDVPWTATVTGDPQSSGATFSLGRIDQPLPDPQPWGLGDGASGTIEVPGPGSYTFLLRYFAADGRVVDLIGKLF